MKEEESRYQTPRRRELDPFEFEEDQPKENAIHKGDQENEDHDCNAPRLGRGIRFRRSWRLLALEFGDLIFDVLLFLLRQIANVDDVSGFEGPDERLNPRY